MSRDGPLAVRRYLLGSVSVNRLLWRYPETLLSRVCMNNKTRTCVMLSNHHCAATPSSQGDWRKGVQVRGLTLFIPSHCCCSDRQAIRDSDSIRDDLALDRPKKAECPSHRKQAWYLACDTY
jgi:hypothetical protein